MSITIESTTDSPEDVTAATGKLSPEPKKEAAPAVKDEEQSETPEDEESEDSDTSDEDEEDTQDEDDDKPRPKKGKGGFKRRIDKLNTKLTAKEQEAEYWRKEALKYQQSKPEQESKDSTKATPQEGKPTPDDFDTQEDYLDALTDWKVDQRLSAQEKKAKDEALKSEVQSRTEAFGVKVKEFAKEHEDFQDVMDDVDDVPLSIAVQESILESDNGPELMYELSKNKAELKRICALPALQAAREIGRFEARLAKSESPTDTTVKTTKAPKPIAPVGAKGSNSTRKSPDEMNYQEYKRWREANT